MEREHKWTVGGHEYRVGPLPMQPGGPIIQRRTLMGAAWETVSSDAAIANEILRLAAAEKSGKK